MNLNECKKENSCWTITPSIPITGDFIGADGAFRYKLSNETTTWYAAVSRCKEWGGELASFSNPALLKYVDEKIHGHYYWIGGSDREKEGQWRWMDGSKTDWTNWAPKEPNGGRVANCLLIIKGAWHDVLCYKRRERFLCQFKAKKICEIQKWWKLSTTIILF